MSIQKPDHILGSLIMSSQRVLSGTDFKSTSTPEVDAEPKDRRKKRWWQPWSSRKRITKDCPAEMDPDVCNTAIYRVNHNCSQPMMATAASSGSESSTSCRTSLSAASTECVRATSLNEDDLKALKKREKESGKLQKRRHRRLRQDYIDGLALGGSWIL
ncbi:hypothetical protein HRR83_001694 [Exophiala dermatitidis]|nr:hypothetical protein HRR73_004828 [Exophiala dermatitidis]KAJ4526500.1 hypothetical protein HRR74_001698 [Exophiala dermatitidis]KAJ4532254.1 hypothetical protein HRR76_007252 [Exophiala dermatitidis]KAJ4546290.1 hypothetical protein HRR77_004825 [Exophiala dermatitidis]KAJ4567467.1 hypothetical protein HRR79_004982 [Exophiala dermatitidis]